MRSKSPHEYDNSLAIWSELKYDILSFTKFRTSSESTQIYWSSSGRLAMERAKYGGPGLASKTTWYGPLTSANKQEQWMFIRIIPNKLIQEQMIALELWLRWWTPPGIFWKSTLFKDWCIRLILINITRFLSMASYRSSDSLRNTILRAVQTFMIKYLLPRYCLDFNINMLVWISHKNNFSWWD